MEVRGFINSDERKAALPRRPRPRPPPRLALRDGSHARGITKLTKPKIKIVHVLEPEIMMTDAANFRDLVQRFTGKPPPPSPSPAAAITGRKTKKKKTLPRTISGGERSPAPRSELEVEEEQELRREFEEERMMVMANDSCGGGGGGGGDFLGEFEGIDFFLEEPSDSINCICMPHL